MRLKTSDQIRLYAVKTGQTRNWFTTAKAELSAFREKRNIIPDPSQLPLCESLRKLHEFVSSLSIRFEVCSSNCIGVSEQVNRKTQEFEFEEFLALIHEIKKGTDFVQLVPGRFYSTIRSFESEQIIVIQGNNTVESLENLLSATKEWRDLAHHLTEKSGPVLEQIYAAAPFLSNSGKELPMHERIKIINAVIDAYVAYKLILSIAGKLKEEDLSIIMQGSEENALFNSIEKLRHEVEARLTRLNSEASAIFTTLSIVEGSIVSIKKSEKQEEKAKLKDHYRTKGTLLAKLSQLNMDIQDATKERTELLREFVELVFPNARRELSTNSEMPKTQEAFEDEPAVPSSEIANPREKTPRETNDFMMTYLPRLYGMLISRTADISRKQVANKMELRTKAKALKTLERTLTKAGVPSWVISEKINSGQYNSEAIIQSYREQSAVQKEPKPENVFKFEKPAKKLHESELINERVLRHFINQLIRAKYGKSLAELKNGEREIIERSLGEINSFLRAYVDYLRQPKGARGKFEKGVESVTLFKSKTWTDIAKPYAWVAFGFQAGGEARIVFCIRPEHNEIALLMAEQRHEAYSLALRMFNGEKDIKNCVVIGFENEKLTFSVAKPKPAKVG